MRCQLHVQLCHELAQEAVQIFLDLLSLKLINQLQILAVIFQYLYKSDKGLTPAAKKEKTKAAASSVTRRTKTQVDVADANDVIRESDVARMSDKQFEERSDEINKAIRSGKFVYDVSGKAR